MVGVTGADSDTGFGSATLWNSDGSAEVLGFGTYGTTYAGTDGTHQFAEEAVWSGSAASAISLHATYSAGILVRVFGSSGGQFVGSAGLLPHAMLWNGLDAAPIDLHPTDLGFDSSGAYGTNGTQQVGSGGFHISDYPYGRSHALLWSGSADSAVDLHPTNIPGMTDSSAAATDGLQQVGEAWNSATPSQPHALLWNGSADSAVDLNPAGFLSSYAIGVAGGKQIGDGTSAAGDEALLWSGTAQSVINLHELLPSDFTKSYAGGIDATGDVFGIAFNATDQLYHSIEWVPAAVPEPNGLVLAGFGLAGLFWMRIGVRRACALAGHSADNRWFTLPIERGSLMNRIFTPVALLTLLAAAGSVAQAAQYTAMDLYSMTSPAGYNQPAFSPYGQFAFGGQVGGSAINANDDPEDGARGYAVLWNSDGSAVVLGQGYLGDSYVRTDGTHQFTSGIVWSGSAASATYLQISNNAIPWVFVNGSGGGQFVGSAYFLAHAILWNALDAAPIDLHPTLLNFDESQALGTNGSQQVGDGNVLIGGVPHTHALLWVGSAESAVDLHPTNIPGMTDSAAVATDGLQQVGEAWNSATLSQPHALLWSGSADSAVDLNPADFAFSYANGVSNGKQIGWGYNTANSADNALLWSGTAQSVLNLHGFLSSDFTRSYASGMNASGDVFGIAFNSSDQTVPRDRMGPRVRPRAEWPSAGWLGTGRSVLDAHPCPPRMCACGPFSGQEMVRSSE